MCERGHINKGPHACQRSTCVPEVHMCAKGPHV